MIRHLFTIIWNERKINTWIVVEYIFIFCILWFCSDYLCYIGRSYKEPLGFDINNTYLLNVVKTTTQSGDEMSNHELVNTFMERVKRHPEIENICFSSASIPYGPYYTLGVPVTYPDSIHFTTYYKDITRDFFDVFRIKLKSGRFFNPHTNQQEVVLSSLRDGSFGIHNGQPYPIEKIKSIGYESYPVVGIVEKVKNTFFYPHQNTMFIPYSFDRVNLAKDQIVIRVKDEYATKNFEERFLAEMQEQLSIGTYIFTSIVSIKDLEKNAMISSGLTNKLNSTYAIITFLIINIFLGIIGTFWYRTQSRRSEIGLRIAMGSTRRNVQKMLYLEPLLLLFTGSIIAVNICLHIGQTDLLATLGLPMAEWTHMNTGWEKEITNYVNTLFFLAFITLSAVWYPARKASTIQPAEALREK